MAARRIRVSLASGLWAWRSVRYLRAGAARQQGVEAQLEASPVTGSLRGIRAVNLVLRATRATCMERSLVVQRFLADRGARHDVVVGVRRGADGAFAAHAWLDGTGDDSGHEYAEIRRRTP
ncbi:MAG: lasso peptide biosynthesis B2 protein [Patulibacter sp.]